MGKLWWSNRSYFLWVLIVIVHTIFQSDCFIYHSNPSVARFDLRNAILGKSLVRCYSTIPPNNVNSTIAQSNDIYSDDEIRLRRGSFKESYAVILPKNMDPYISEAEKNVIREKEEAEKEGLSEVDILREQLRKLLAKMDENP